MVSLSHGGPGATSSSSSSASTLPWPLDIRRGLLGMRGLHRRRSSAQLALVAVMSASLLSLARTFVCAPQSNGVPRRRDVLLASAPALAVTFGVREKESEATAKAIPLSWIYDIRRAASGLADLAGRWDTDIMIEDQMTAGANKAREALTIKYTTTLTVTVPAGVSLGINARGCVVTSVQKPELGWREDDIIIEADGYELQRNQDFLDKYLKFAKDEDKKFLVKREYPPLLDNLERKLQAIYVDGNLDDDNLPDLEDLQLLIGELKVYAKAAASGTTVSYVTMNRLKEAVSKLRDQLAPIAKALA